MQPSSVGGAGEYDLFTAFHQEVEPHMRGEETEGSTSLVAIHMASQGLLSGEVDAVASTPSYDREEFRL